VVIRFDTVDGMPVKVGLRQIEEDSIERLYGRESIAPHIGDPRGLSFYGYQWWLGRSLLNKREVPWVEGAGFGGQRVFVVPVLDLVVVVTAGLYSSPLQYWLPEEILNRYVLPAIKE
jgi:CubicO group peptidase (beta-lactamase class C family)